MLKQASDIIGEDGKTFGKYQVYLLFLESSLKFYLFFVSKFDIREQEEYK